MKDIKNGFQKLWQTRRRHVIGELLCFAAFSILLFLHIWTGSGQAWLCIVWLLLIALRLVQLALLYRHDAKSVPQACSARASTVPTECPLLSMRVVSLICRRAENPSLLDPACHRLEKLSVVFENKTGHPISSDDSFSLECKVGQTWRVIEPLDTAGSDWKALEIPKGLSEKIGFFTFHRYAPLPAGTYRMAKELEIDGNLCTFAAEFPIGH